MSGKVSWQARFESARSNRLFELFIILVIIASALLIGVKTYQLPSWVKPLIDGLDLLITLIFLVEISIRFLGEPQKRAFFRNGWNVFDTLVVVVSLIPVNDSELALLARQVIVIGQRCLAGARPARDEEVAAAERQVVRILLLLRMRWIQLRLVDQL